MKRYVLSNAFGDKGELTKEALIERLNTADYFAWYNNQERKVKDFLANCEGGHMQTFNGFEIYCIDCDEPLGGVSEIEYRRPILNLYQRDIDCNARVHVVREVDGQQKNFWYSF